MSDRLLPALDEDLEGEWLEPTFRFPPVPSYYENMKLVEIEEKVRGAAAFLEAAWQAVQVGRRDIRESGGTNILYVDASTQRICIEARTPFWRRLESRTVIDMPPLIKNAR